jgi:decaprenyl-phosphate phosphoribosyltransferase
MGMISAIFRLARPHQYTKNLFVFVPAFFAFQLTDSTVIAQTLLAFVAFSLLASGVYVFNDWMDRAEDARHPTKCKRPIASGEINTLQAAVIFVVFVGLGLLAGWQISPELVSLLVGYFVMNLAYSVKLKHIAIIDIVVIALGFVIRLGVGAMAAGVALSHWIIVMTFLLALFLALAKRRDDVLIFLETEQKMRKVIDGYNLKFLDAAMVMNAGVVMVAYILWSISAEVVARIGSDNLYMTAVFVLLGIMRYMQIAMVQEQSGNPTRILLKDRFLQSVLVGWVASFVLILYWN